MPQYIPPHQKLRLKRTIQRMRGMPSDEVSLLVDRAQQRSGVGSFATLVGDGAATSIVVTHGLGTRDVNVAVRLAATPFTVEPVDWAATTINTVTLTFGSAPAADEFRCVVMG